MPLLKERTFELSLLSPITLKSLNSTNSQQVRNKKHLRNLQLANRLLIKASPDN